jgi:hypothetical protein
MIWPRSTLTTLPNDLGDEGRFVQRQRQARRFYGGQLYADHRQRVVTEDHLQDERRATEDDRIGAGDEREDGKAAELHAGEHDRHHKAAAKAESGDEKRVEDAGKEIGLR